ncbi:hypothetical protein CNYM01_14383, partial [Colletotrichum nymphaeae SA-01]
ATTAHRRPRSRGRRPDPLPEDVPRGRDRHGRHGHRAGPGQDDGPAVHGQRLHVRAGLADRIPRRLGRHARASLAPHERHQRHLRHGRHRRPLHPRRRLSPPNDPPSPRRRLRPPRLRQRLGRLRPHKAHARHVQTPHRPARV